MSTPSNRKRLPVNPSLEHLQKQAKRRVKEDSSLHLAAAQHQIAREYGYKNWAELALAVHTISRRADPPGMPEPETSFQSTRVAETELNPKSEWRNAGDATASACFETQCWASATGNIKALLATLLIDDAARAHAQAALERLPADLRKKVATADDLIALDVLDKRNFAAIKVIEEVPADSGDMRLRTLWKYDDGRIRENSYVTYRHTETGWRTAIATFRFSPHLEARLRGVRLDQLKGSSQAILRQPKTPSVRIPQTGGIRLVEGMVPVSSLKNRGMATPAAAFETLFWAKEQLDVDLLARVIETRQPLRDATACFARLSADKRAKFTGPAKPQRLAAFHWAVRNGVVGVRLQTESSIDANHAYLSGVFQDEFCASAIDAVFVRTVDGWRWLMDDRRFIPTGLMIRQPRAFPFRVIRWLLDRFRAQRKHAC